MIVVTRLNGAPFALNPDLVERVDVTPDTVVTCVDGTRYVVRESLDEVISLVREFRASVLVAAQRLDRSPVERSLRAVPPATEG